MQFNQLVAAVATDRLGDLDVVVTGLTYDSRRVQRGNVFVCLRGQHQDGHHHAAAAVAAGAVGLVVEEPLPLSVPQAMVPSTRRVLLPLARRWYGDPAAHLGLVGITGTNGKTTTAFLARSVIAAGLTGGQFDSSPTATPDVGLLGTVINQVGPQPEPAAMTTPEALDVMGWWRRAVDAGCPFLVMEVSSHALAQDRVDPADFDVTVVTNIRRDHFEFHGDFPGYLAAKARLFSGMRPEAKAPGWPRAAVINADDPIADHLLQVCPVPAVTYGLHAPHVDVTARRLRAGPGGVSLELQLPGTTPFPVRLRLPGRFNVYNALAAAAVGWCLGTAPAAIRRGLESVAGVPGRTEAIHAGQPFDVVVDFAHNPSALEQVLTLRPRRRRGRVILVFGAEGGKDPGKRWAMGRAATRADYAIITSDNVYAEDPAAVAAQLAEPLAGHPHRIILDRREAIAAAFALAAPGDLVIIAGKGHEQTWHLLGQAVPFDDRQVARELLAERRRAVSEVPPGPDHWVDQP